VMIACEKAVEKLGFTPSSEFFHSLIGRNAASAEKMMQDYYGETLDYDLFLEEYRKYFNHHMETVGAPMKQGLPELLDALENWGIKKCIATSSRRARAMQTLSQVKGMFERFDALVCGDEIKNGKPDPEIFLKAAASCQVAPKNCVVLEDSLAGIEAAFLAGMQAIMVPDIVPPTPATHARASAVCKNLTDAQFLLAKKNLFRLR
jgi:HAD superfamily hydrolase (TIGR01509 family)